MKLLASTNNAELRQGGSNFFRPTLLCDNELDGCIKSGEDSSSWESCSKCMEGYLLCMSTNKGNLLYPIDETVGFSSIIDNKLAVVVSTA